MVSLGAGPVADNIFLPPISYARIHLNQKKNKPMEKFPQDVLDITKTTNDPDNDMESTPNKLDKEQKKLLIEHIEESACIIGRGTTRL